MLKLLEDKNEVCIREMKDGDIGIITNWSSCTDTYCGRIVQRYQDTLITLGADSDKSWGNIFKQTFDSSCCVVKILPPGTTFVIE